MKHAGEHHAEAGAHSHAHGPRAHSAAAMLGHFGHAVGRLIHGELLQAAEQLPDIYFSSLDDIFLRSAYFCDWLRSEPGL